MEQVDRTHTHTHPPPREKTIQLSPEQCTGPAVKSLESCSVPVTKLFRSAILTGAVNARDRRGGEKTNHPQKNPTTKKTKLNQHLLLKRGTV